MELELLYDLQSVSNMKLSYVQNFFLCSLFHERQRAMQVKNNMRRSKHWFLNIFESDLPSLSVYQWLEWSWSPLLLLLLQRLFVSASETWQRLSSIPSTPSMTCTAHTPNSTAKVFHHVRECTYDFKILIAFYRAQTHLSLAGVQPPRPPPPSSNGNLPTQDRIVVYQTGQPVRRPCVSRLNDICTSTRRHYFLSCAAIIAFLLILILIFSFLGEEIYLLKLKLWN